MNSADNLDKFGKCAQFSLPNILKSFHTFQHSHPDWCCSMFFLCPKMQWFNCILNCCKRKLIASNRTEVLPRCHTFVKLDQKNMKRTRIMFYIMFFSVLSLVSPLNFQWLQSRATCLLLESRNANFRALISCWHISFIENSACIRFSNFMNILLPKVSPEKMSRKIHLFILLWIK